MLCSLQTASLLELCTSPLGSRVVEAALKADGANQPRAKLRKAMLAECPRLARDKLGSFVVEAAFDSSAVDDKCKLMEVWRLPVAKPSPLPWLIRTNAFAGACSCGGLAALEHPRRVSAQEGDPSPSPSLPHSRRAAFSKGGLSPRGSCASLTGGNTLTRGGYASRRRTPRIRIAHPTSRPPFPTFLLVGAAAFPSVFPPSLPLTVGEGGRPTELFGRSGALVSDVSSVSPRVETHLRALLSGLRGAPGRGGAV